MSDASIVCSSLSFAWPDDTPVFHDPFFTAPPGRTGGLVAHNGSGESTLLKLIAGELKPATVSLCVGGTLGHLPQSLPLTGSLTVAEVLGIASVNRALDALDAVESGEMSEKSFTTIGDDLVSAGRLEGALNSYQGAFLVVSHDERFLAEIGVKGWLRLADAAPTETEAPEV
jgi:ATPase subunit of ABC transporter with duplicated ATPase domains